MKIAIKIGGSVFCPTEEPDAGFVERLAKTLLGISERHRLLVVVGGGRLARKLIGEAKARVNAEDELHEVGITAARMNASVLADALEDKAFQRIPRNVDEVRKAFESGKIIVVGGFKPGQTTDAVTAQSAEAIGADLMIIGTDVKGVYDCDPKGNPDAEFIPRISASKLMLIVRGAIEPGRKTIVDPIAVDCIGRTGIKTMIMDVHEPGNLEKAIEGGGFEGTVVE